MTRHLKHPYIALVKPFDRFGDGELVIAFDREFCMMIGTETPRMVFCVDENNDGMTLDVADMLIPDTSDRVPYATYNKDTGKTKVTHFYKWKPKGYTKVTLPANEFALLNRFGESWYNALDAVLMGPYFLELLTLNVQLRQKYGDKLYPAKENIFRAFGDTTFEGFKVLILGQDPYSYNSIANGLAFASATDAIPPSLGAIQQAIRDDFGYDEDHPFDATLSYLAKQGVILLNSTLIAIDGKSGEPQLAEFYSRFTREVIEVMSNRPEPFIAILIGAEAKKFARYIDNRHLVFDVEHPAFAARESRKWQHLKVFHKTNLALESNGYSPIEW